MPLCAIKQSSAWFEHSTDNREAAGSTPASRTKLSMRASEPVSCWPHKPCEWRSTRQPATSFLGESFNGRTAGLQPANEGSIPSSSTKFAREAVARTLNQRRAGLKSRAFFKQAKHVRLVLLAPSVTVAEWLRRQTVDLSTRVQFPPVTPIYAGVVQRIEHFGPNEEMPVRLRSPVPVRVGRSPVG